MKKEMFKPYREFLLKLLWKIETKEELLIGHHLIDDFTNTFRGVLQPMQVNEAEMELLDVLQEKQNSETII